MSETNLPLQQSQSTDLANIFRQHSGNEMLLQGVSDKSYLSRLSLYVDWLNATGRHWTRPALDRYGNFLLSDARLIEHQGKISGALKPSSAKIHLSTIRSRYREIIQHPDFKQLMRQVALAGQPDAAPSDIRALVLDMRDDLQDALNPKLTNFVKPKKKQDSIDSQQLRLTEAQAQALVDSPGIETLIGLRDTALLYFMFSTGLREQEICNLDVIDLRQTVNGELGVHVRDGKGAKERFVPYGDNVDCLMYIDAWLVQCNISEGAVFRGFKDRHTPVYAPGDKSPTMVYGRLTERLHVRSVNHILKQYPVMIEGTMRTINPHDTRRTYAKLQYNNGNGLDMLAIRDNLGHEDVKTTQGYIGDVDMDKRRGKRMIKTKHDKRRLQQLGTVETWN